MKDTFIAISELPIENVINSGFFNSHYGWLFPGDREFFECISGLDTPRKIGDYMSENFIYEKQSDSDLYEPYITWKTKKGSCNNFSEFGAFVADYHGYRVYQVGMTFKETSDKHLITIYVEDKGLSFTHNQIYINNKGYFFHSLEHILKFMDINKDPECQLKIDTKKLIVKCYQDREIKRLWINDYPEKII